MNSYREYLSRFYNFNDDEWSIFSSALLKKNIPKGEVLLKENEVCNFLSFIESGAFRTFFQKGDTEKTFRFYFAGEYITNYRGFFHREPSRLGIQSITDSVVWEIDYENFIRIESQSVSPDFRVLRGLVLELHYKVYLDRTIDLIKFSNEENYLRLLERNPRLLQEVPQYMIASYLGVSPETLSRIRKRISSKNLS